MRDEYGIEPVKWGPYIEGSVFSENRPHAKFPGPMGAPYNGFMFQVGDSFWTNTGEPLEITYDPNNPEYDIPLYEWQGMSTND